MLLGLVEAKDAGYTVTESVINRGLNYLRIQIEPLVGLKDPYLVNRQAFLLYVLARAGEPDVSSSVQLYDQRQRMGVYAQAFLTQTLHWIDASDPRLETLLSDLSSLAIVSATGTHWEEKEIDRWNWNTDTRTTAIVLATLSVDRPAEPDQRQCGALADEQPHRRALAGHPGDGLDADGADPLDGCQR